LALFSATPARGQPEAEAPADSSAAEGQRTGSPAASAATDLDSAPPAPGSSGPSADQPEPIEVIVEGERPMEAAQGAGQQSFEGREMQRIPGAFGDPFRVVEVLPGVVPIASGLPHFAVRGALPSSTGYYIDSIRVPFLFHLGVGPSVVNPAMIGGMDFYPGPYPVSYGRHVGGVVAAHTMAPRSRVRAEASIRVFDAGAFVEVPLLEGDVSAFAGARYSYTAAALSLFAPDTRLSYWDYQGGGSVRLSERDRIRVMAFGSDDYLGEVEGEDTDKELFAAQFHRIHLRYEHTPKVRELDGKPSPHEPSSHAGLTLGYDRTGLGSEGEMEVLGLGLLAHGELPLAQVLRLRLGGSIQIDDHDLTRRGAEPPPEEPEEPEEPEPGSAEDQFDFDVGDAFAIDRAATIGGYFDLVLRPIGELEIVPGLRADVFTEDGYALAGVEPRGTVRTRPLPWLTTVSAVGLAHQRPALLVSVPGLDPRALDGGLQEVIQLSQGVGFAVGELFDLGLTGFVHWYSNLTDLTATCAVGVRKCAIGDRADGRAYGLEATVRRSLSERVGGMISYTLSRAERTAHGETTLADFDRTHVLHLVVGVDLGRRWHAGARLTAYSGRPYSLTAFDDSADPTRGTLVGRRNALRREMFHRIDLRVEKRWVIAERGWVSFVIEGMNVTLQKETVDFDCRVAEVVGTDSGLSCGGQEVGPITIPSIGVSGGF
jgi:hypothetical protein